MGKRFLVLLALLPFILVSVPAYSMTLRQAIAQAIKTNPRIKAAQANRRASDYVLDQATGRFLPEVDLRADVGFQRIDKPQGFGPLVNDRWRNRRKATLSVRQILFDGWDRANDVYQSRARISAASFKVLARSELIALNVVEAYIDVIRHQNLLSLAKRNVSRHRKLLGLVQARVSGGKSPAGDLEQTKERLQATLSLVSQIKIALDTAKAKFKGAVGVSPRSLKAIKSVRLEFKSASSATQFALTNNPRLKALGSEIEARGFQKEQSRSKLLPEIYAEGSATRAEDVEGTPGRADELKAMIVLRWKLYDGGVRQSRIMELSEREYEKIAEYDILVRRLTEQIEVSWARVTEGRTQVSVVRKQLTQNRRVLSAYKAEYEADKRSLLDVLDAENTLFATEFELSNIRALQRFASYQMVAHTGNLLKKFNVQRPAGAEQPLESSRSLFRSVSKHTFAIPSLRQD